MILLIVSAAAFLGLHHLVSGSPLRGRIVKAIGEKAYMGLFAISVMTSLVTMCWAYGRAYVGPDNGFLFDYSQGWRNLALPVVGLALLIVVPGVLGGNPTNPGQEQAELRGILRVTRHPFLWGVTIWAGFHFVGSGDYASSILFGTFVLLALPGTLLIDAKSRKRLGPQWQRVAAVSSNIPFAAILQGRNRFVFKEYFDWRFVVAVGVFLLFTFFHAYLFGQSPFPQGWLPDFDPIQWL